MDRKLDLDKLKDKKHTVISSEEALKDIEPWYKPLEIKNQRIKSYYESLQRIINNTEFSREKRMKAFEKAELVEAMVLTYECGEEFDPEDDLRLSYEGRLLPEEIKEIIKQYKNTT